MKKLIFAFAIVATLVVALLSTGNVYAQGTTPPAPQTPGSGNGYGRGGGMRGGGMGFSGTGQGILHDAMLAAFSQKLAIPVDDLEARLAKGETMAQIAYAKGLTAEQFNALMQDARSQAIDQAVKDGTLTQEQADWMKTRGMSGAGRGMGRGNGLGNAANCPYYSQTNQ
jgi:hypothetical protein